MENSQQNSWKCLVSGLCWIHFHSCPKPLPCPPKKGLSCHLLLLLLPCPSKPSLHSNLPYFPFPMSFSILLTSTCVPVYVEQLVFDCECALFCCGVFHAHLLHVEMKLRYFMWWWCDPMSSSTRQTQPGHVFPLTDTEGLFWQSPL